MNANARLTAEENRVAELAAWGLSQKEIADTLNISPAELMGWEECNADRKGATATNNYTETDLRKMAENAKTFDGKPLNEYDIQAIQNIIEIYLKGRI